MRISNLTAVAYAILATSDAFCLSNSQAEVIGDDFAQLISNYSAAFANIVLANDYTDQSDSVNTLIDSGTESPIPVCANSCERFIFAHLLHPP